MPECNTLRYYENHAEEYCEQTRNWDMRKHYALFEKYLPENAYILDFGCGSGRDSKHFLEQGHQVRATDGSRAICEIASDFIGQEVEHLYFDQLDDKNTYDGIWACASILHLERKKLPGIFTKMLRALKPGGIIYTSFKVGTGARTKEGKLYTEFTLEELAKLIAGLPIPAQLIDSSFNTSHKRSRPGTNQWGNYIIQNLQICR